MADLGPLVVDANMLFGALVRDSTNRDLMLHGELDLHAPDWLWDELQRNRATLTAKGRVSDATLDLLVAALREHIRSIPLATIRPHLPTALGRVGEAHALDAPYVAAAIAIGGGVWSHDKHLAACAGVPVHTTADLLAALRP